MYHEILRKQTVRSKLNKFEHVRGEQSMALYGDCPCRQNDRQKDLTEDVTLSQLLLAGNNENASPQN